jgi:hypothetical protein
MPQGLDTSVPKHELSNRGPDFPGRRVLTVQGMRVLLDAEDSDLAQWNWRLSTRTALRRRVRLVDTKTKRVTHRWVVLHRQIAKRAFGLAEEPLRVGFRNKAILDCRRQNLVLMD